jgi:DNA-binding transcriptional ArsR family regulator
MIETFEIAAKALADRSRIRILKLLEGGELCVCQITAVMDLAPATVSKHLSLLKTAGLLQQRRDGRWIHYRLAERALNGQTIPFLQLLAGALNDDQTILEDRAMLERVNAVPLQTLCDQGRSALETPACCGVQP